eukprot:12968-Heterococcus_DN1.PRE.2
MLKFNRAPVQHAIAAVSQKGNVWAAGHAAGARRRCKLEVSWATSSVHVACIEHTAAQQQHERREALVN